MNWFWAGLQFCSLIAGHKLILSPFKRCGTVLLSDVRGASRGPQSHPLDAENRQTGNRPDMAFQLKNTVCELVLGLAAILLIRCFDIVNENLHFVVNKVVTKCSNHAIG